MTHITYADVDVNSIQLNLNPDLGNLNKCCGVADDWKGARVTPLFKISFLHINRAFALYTQL